MILGSQKRYRIGLTVIRPIKAQSATRSVPSEPLSTITFRLRKIHIRHYFATEAAVAINSEAPKPKPTVLPWQRQIIPLEQWLPKVAVDAYVAPNVVLAGSVTVWDGSSVWNSAVLRGDLNKITVGFCSNVQERCAVHAARPQQDYQQRR
ncbi:unnamed protein product [Eruca vesicaria subsp. sativa]|uniref:Uncharacterized protein n=1 Tax=Eruca vesicaria subsp. sativa TaxID=29727 RepID=A0ABC8JZY8_ERUVS|nr:unnamed protein product [Eruca vesicaria subsp. sativa]